MIIIVEGIDRVGKSTLCEKLSKELNMPIFHDEYKCNLLMGFNKNNLIYNYRGSKYIQNLVDEIVNVKFQTSLQLLKLLPNIIVDRYHLTELVYDDLRGMDTTDNFINVDNVLCDRDDVALILVESEDIEESSRQHGSDLAKHQEMFSGAFDISRIRCKYKTSYSKLDDIVQKLKMLCIGV